MIVCSCNVFSDHEIRAALAGPETPGTVSQVYRRFGEALCGRCTRTVCEILRECEAAAAEGQR